MTDSDFLKSVGPETRGRMWRLNLIPCFDASEELDRFPTSLGNEISEFERRGSAAFFKSKIVSYWEMRNYLQV